MTNPYQKQLKEFLENIPNHTVGKYWTLEMVTSFLKQYVEDAREGKEPNFKRYEKLYTDYSKRPVYEYFLSWLDESDYYLAFSFAMYSMGNLYGLNMQEQAKFIKEYLREHSS